MQETEVSGEGSDIIVIDPEPETELSSEPESEAVTEAETESETASEPESEVVTEEETESEAASEPESETVTETERTPHIRESEGGSGSGECSGHFSGAVERAGCVFRCSGLFRWFYVPAGQSRGSL